MGIHIEQLYRDFNQGDKIFCYKGIDNNWYSYEESAFIISQNKQDCDCYTIVYCGILIAVCRICMQESQDKDKMILDIGRNSYKSDDYHSWKDSLCINYSSNSHNITSFVIPHEIEMLLSQKCGTQYKLIDAKLLGSLTLVKC